MSSLVKTSTIKVGSYVWQAPSAEGVIHDSPRAGYSHDYY
jgi:hypothetical protein